MHKLSLNTAYKVVMDWEENRSYKATALKHRVDPRTVKAWVAIWLEHGTLDVKFSVKRKLSVSPKAAAEAAELLAAGTHGGAGSVAAELHRRGLTTKTVHRTTLARHAKQAAKASGRRLKVERGKPKKRLALTNMAERVAFAGANKKRDWGNVMITDRKRFIFNYPGERVAHTRWSFADSPTAVYHATSYRCVNMYAGLTKYGVTKPHLVTGTTGMATDFKNKQGNKSRNITEQEYKVVLQKTLLPEGSRIFGAQGLSSWVLQQDGDPAHNEAEAVAAAYSRQHSAQLQVLARWPSNSPDLSPIENLWSIVERRVQAAGCKDFAEFKATLVKEWNGVSKELCGKLMGSMGSRLEACLEKGGKRFSY